MADIQRPTSMVYPDLPREESNLRSAMMRELFSQREREYIGYSSDIAENNNAEIEEQDNINTRETSLIINGVNRISNGIFFSDDETTSSLSELSSDHDSSLDSIDSLDNCQNSVVDASENIQSDPNGSENDQNSTFDGSEKNQKIQFNGSNRGSNYNDSDRDSIEPSYNIYETNNVNGISSDGLISPSFTLPQDQTSCTTPQNPELPTELQNDNDEICSNSVSKYQENIEGENGENGNCGSEKNLGEKYNSENESNYEESEDELPALSVIQAKIEELAKWKKDVWARLREQSESSSTPEPKSENGMPVDISVSLSTPKVENDDASIKIPPEDGSRSTTLIRQDETNLITSYHHTNEPNPMLTNNESKSSNPVPCYDRSESMTFSNRARNDFSNHERNEFGPFHERLERKFFPVSERFDSFLYSTYERDSRLFFEDRYDTRSYSDDRYETFLYGNSERNDSCRFSSHERNDPGRFLNHERLDSSVLNRQDVDITAFHQQLPPAMKRHNEQNPPLGPLHKRSRHMPNGFHYDPMNHGPNNGIYGPPPTGPSGMSGSGMMGRGRDDQYHHYYHRNDYRPPPPYFDRQGPYGRGHMNNISRRPIGGPSRPLSRPQERPRGRY